MTYNSVHGWLIVTVVLMSFAIVLNIVVWVANWRKRRALPTLSEALGVVTLVLLAIDWSFLLYVENAGNTPVLVGIGLVVSAIIGVLWLAIVLIQLALILRRTLERQRPSDTR